MTRNIAHIVQLPFPSTSEPHATVDAYYRDYSEAFQSAHYDYFIPTNSLWELPLWVTHLGGMLEALGYKPNFINLSTSSYNSQACAEAILGATKPDARILLSPLAQNFDFAIEISQTLMAEGRYTIVGGNMATLTPPGSASMIHKGPVTLSGLASIVQGRDTSPGNSRGAITEMSWRPNYQLLNSFRNNVPLLRLNASHGCLFACDFCGDAWSRSLTVVPKEFLEFEISQFETLFPETQLIYIGDKTFGQSSESVQNLLDAFKNRDGYKFIVQTHVQVLKHEVLDAMKRLGVVAVELGFESGSPQLMRKNSKSNRDPQFVLDAIRRLNDWGFHVVLNVLSGLPEETEMDHLATVDFIRESATDVWLYNLYNFVPYPLTTQYLRIKGRIVDWKFSNWREDGLPVFEPLHVTREESFAFFIDKVRTAHGIIKKNALARPDAMIPPRSKVITA